MPGGVGGARVSLASTRFEVGGGRKPGQSAQPCGSGASRRPYRNHPAPRALPSCWCRHLPRTPFAWLPLSASGSVATERDVTAPSQLERSGKESRGRSQLV